MPDNIILICTGCGSGDIQYGGCLFVLSRPTGSDNPRDCRNGIMNISDNDTGRCPYGYERDNTERPISDGHCHWRNINPQIDSLERWYKRVCRAGAYFECDFCDNEGVSNDADNGSKCLYITCFSDVREMIPNEPDTAAFGEPSDAWDEGLCCPARQNYYTNWRRTRPPPDWTNEDLELDYDLTDGETID